MIEIRIPTSAAILLLKEKMNLEFESWKKNESLPSYVNLEDLGYRDLIQITEAAAFDLIFSLPAEIYVDESNIAHIIYKSIRSLASVYGKEEFNLYSEKKAEKLVNPIRVLFKKYGKKEVFEKN